MIYTGINWTDQEPDFWNDFTDVLVPYPTPPWIEWAKTGEMDEKKKGTAGDRLRRTVVPGKHNMEPLQLDPAIQVLYNVKNWSRYSNNCRTAISAADPSRGTLHSAVGTQRNPMHLSLASGCMLRSKTLNGILFFVRI